MFTVRLPTISYVIHVPCPEVEYPPLPLGHTDTHPLDIPNPLWIPTPCTNPTPGLDLVPEILTPPPPGDMVPEITPNGQTLHVHATLFVGGQAGKPAVNELSS